MRADSVSTTVDSKLQFNCSESEASPYAGGWSTSEYSYITPAFFFHYLVAVLCNSANGEIRGGGGLNSKSGSSQVSCFCRGSQCRSLLGPYEAFWFTPKLSRFSSGPDNVEAAEDQISP